MQITKLNRLLALVDWLLIIEKILFLFFLLSSFQIISILLPATSVLLLLLTLFLIPLTMFVQYLLRSHLDRKAFSKENLEKLENQDYILYLDGRLERKEPDAKSIFERLEHPASQILFNFLFYYFLLKDYRAMTLIAETTNIELDVSSIHKTILICVCLNIFANIFYFRVSDRFLLYCGELILLTLVMGIYQEYGRIIY